MSKFERLMYAVTMMIMVVITSVNTALLVYTNVNIKQTVAEIEESYEVSYTGFSKVIEKNEEKAVWLTDDERELVLGLNETNENGEKARIYVDMFGKRWVQFYSEDENLYDVIRRKGA